MTSQDKVMLFILHIEMTLVATLHETNSSANFKQLSHEQAVARTHNSTYKKLAAQCSADSFVVNLTLVLHINICEEKSPTSCSCKPLCKIIDETNKWGI